MAGKTSIEWTHMPGYEGDVWNPTTGCTRVSAGCDNCYAFALHDRRYAGNLAAAKRTHPLNKLARADLEEGVFRAHHPELVGKKRGLSTSKQYDRPFSQVQLLEDRLDVPLRRKKPTCYFVDSMSDLFHEDVPDEYMRRVFVTMGFASQHKFLVLTKRPERMSRFIRDVWMMGVVEPNGALPNVWLGTSVEDQASADERIPFLLATPAAVRFLSCEPLLGPVDLAAWMRPEEPRFEIRQDRMANIVGAMRAVDAETTDRLVALGRSIRDQVRPDSLIDWIIVGGESGSRARPMDLAWARSLVAQCRAAGVAPFVKQLGSWPAEEDELADEESGREIRDVGGRTYVRVHLRESHGRDMAEWPEDLRVREWPR